jgi:hypothetical protein
MTIPQAYFADLPSSIDGPLAHAISIFGLFGACLLAAEWLWRISWAAIERPHPLCHPVSVIRMTFGLILIALILRVSPDVAITVMWTDLQPETRYWLGRVNRLLDGVSVIPMLGAWLLSLFSTTLVEYQLARAPLPVTLWPTWRRVRRPLWIGALLLFISLVIAYMG